MPNNIEKETRTVTVALGLLDWFSLERQHIGLSEFVKLSGLSKATVFRHLTALEKSGFIKKEQESKKYQLGYKPMELAYLVKKQTKLRDVVLPYMKKLKEITDETVSLQIEDKGRGICIERIDSSSTLVYLPPIGSREYLHAGASRKVLLSFLHDERIEEIIAEGLPSIVNNTVTEYEQLWREIKDIRKKGYALSEGEHLDGVAAIAAPIRKGNGTVLASLSIVGPSFRIGEEQKKRFLPYLLESVRNISRELGFKVEEDLSQGMKGV